MRYKEGKVLIIGDIMLDEYIFGNVKRISPEAPVPILKCNHKRDKAVLGGAANVAANIVAAGCNASIMSIVGNDRTGKKLQELLSGCGIQDDYLNVIDGRTTTLKLRYVGQNNQQVIRIDDEETKDILDEQWEIMLRRLENNISDISVIVLSDYGKGMVTEEFSQAVINLAKKNKITVLADVKGSNWEKYRGVSLIKPNRDELALLTGMSVETLEDVKAAAVSLCRKAESEYVLATLGANGMLLVSQSGIVKLIESVAQDVYDVTGAGDTTIAYLAAGVCCGMGYEQAMEYANYAAGVQVSKVGTSIVYPIEVEAAQKSCGKLDSVKRLSDTEAAVLKLRELQKHGKRIVFTNGCFDILHKGHISYLKKAREMGDVLAVGVNSDASVKRIKGAERPINSLDDRLSVLAALECVDYVIPFEEDTPLNLICGIHPDVLVKGGDYKIEDIVGADFVSEYGGTVATIPLVEGKSTTNIINRILG